MILKFSQRERKSLEVFLHVAHEWPSVDVDMWVVGLMPGDSVLIH